MRIHPIIKRSIRPREGRGFSKAELKDAKLSVNEALKHGIPIDLRRSTNHEENVMTLKTHIEKMEHKASAKEEKIKATMLKIEDIEGIGPTYANKFVEAGIKTTEDLLEAGSTPKGRETLAQKTGIEEKLILEWVNLADLFRIRGVGEEYSDLLEEAGVDTVVELSKRVPENLHAKIVEVTEQKKLVLRPPNINMVKRWVEDAKKLPRKVEY